MAVIDELNVKISVKTYKIVKNKNYKWWKFWQKKYIEVIIED